MYDIIVNTDASLANSRNVGCIAWVIKDADGKIIERRAQVVHQEEMNLETTLLELLAIKSAIKRIRRLGLSTRKILIRTDSNSAIRSIRQAKISFPVAPHGKKELFYLAHSIIGQVNNGFGKIEIEWTPRAQNRVADGLARFQLKKAIIWLKKKKKY
jgi:ribonuclease HI